MKLTVFQSDKGDCLLLRGAGQNGPTILVDGGMAASYRAHVAESLSQLGRIDRVYVSHIDEDHISGVLQMFDDKVAHLVHRFQIETGNVNHRAPRQPEPPEVTAVWQNAFHDTMGSNAGDIEEVLATVAEILSGSPEGEIAEAAREPRELATSIKQSLQLSKRIGDGQLGLDCSSELPGSDANRRHMQSVEELVAELEERSEGRMTSFFLTESEFQIDL